MKTILHTETLDSAAANYLALYREFVQLQLYQKAEQTLLVALEKLTHHPDLLSQLIEHYMMLDMTDKAMTIANRLIRQYPDLKTAYSLRGMLHERNGDERRAQKDYERAVNHVSEDEVFLRRLLKIQIKFGEFDEALQLIRAYQVVLRNPGFMADVQALLHLQLGESNPAFSTLRGALIRNPGSKDLLMDYLKQSNRNGKRAPGEVYYLLQNSIPNLTDLSVDDLADLEIDFYEQQGDIDRALELVSEKLIEEPDNYFWRKRRAFIKLESGQIEESVPEMRILFLQNAADKSLRKALENYYLMMDQSEQWKMLVQQALREQENQLPLYHYLRRIGGNPDWLNLCRMTNAEFQTEIEQLELATSDIRDVTYQKLPPYALEMFLSHLAIHHSIPSPEELWRLISNERAKRKQVPPFELDDLQDSYPAWLFGIHIYLMFRHHTQLNVAFVPSLYQSEQIASIVINNEIEIEIDLSPTLATNKRYLKSVVKTKNGFRWRMHEFVPKTDININKIPLYSAHQFTALLEVFSNDLEEELPGLLTNTEK